MMIKKKILIMVSLLFTTVLLMACMNNPTITNQSEDNECNCGLLEVTMFHYSFEEVLASSTDVVIAQIVERRPFGSGMAEVEFVVSERIFGDAPDRIFVYLDNANIAGWGGSYRTYEAEFEEGVEYLLVLSIHRRVISNFHEDGYFFVGGIPIVNLDNPIESTMYNQSIVRHSTDLDFSDPMLSRDQIVSFAREVTRNNTPADERETYGDFIRSNNMEDIISGSSEILVVEINELLSSTRNCWRSSETYSASIVQTLKGEFEVGEEFRLPFFMDTVRPGELHIIAVRSGVFHEGTGMWITSMTSRHSLFNMDQLDEIKAILGY